MHRAGVLGARNGEFFRLGRQVVRRFGIEFCLAFGTAETVMDAIQIRRMGRLRLDGHAADGIDNVVRHGFQNRRRMAVMMSMVVMLP